jgi:Pentapeptide repeats (8 copies)
MAEGREQRNARGDGSSQAGSDDASRWREIALIIFSAVVVFVLASVLWANRQRDLQQLIADLGWREAALFLTLIFIVVAVLVYFVAKRTLWELLQLLVVPLALVGIGLWFTAQQDARQLEIEKQRAQDEALQAYLDQLGSLLLDKDLRASDKGSEVRTLARARTLTVLRRLDSKQKTAVMRFLLETKLIQRTEGREHVIKLALADLAGANLTKARLNGAALAGANLREADLSGTKLREADLRKVNLTGANLLRANLLRANLLRANLTGAVLRKAKGWTPEQLEQAASLEGATMPNGQKHEDWLKSKGRGENGENSGT